jgi:hypothetical protein
VILATPDDVLAQVVTDLARADAFAEGQRVVHVSGSQGLAVLERAALAGARVAACHPAQTVPAGTPDPDVFVGSAWAVTCRSIDRPGPMTWWRRSAATRTTCRTTAGCSTTPP